MNKGIISVQTSTLLPVDRGRCNGYVEVAANQRRPTRAQTEGEKETFLPPFHVKASRLDQRSGPDNFKYSSLSSYLIQQLDIDKKKNLYLFYLKELPVAFCFNWPALLLELRK